MKKLLARIVTLLSTETEQFSQAKKTLEDLGHVIDVCHICTVTDRYECTDEEARDILDDVYNELCDTIDRRILDRCEFLGYKEKDE
tara:strand:- start:10403 stop:10660 length:258 start_codon:yes stop_codon:yes gene_type:complete